MTGVQTCALPISIQVEDSGPGIPLAEREQVFRPFYRLLGTQVDGSGLGLAIVGEIARQHGASVALDDAAPRPADGERPDGGPGARFTLRFPAAPAADAADPSAEASGRGARHRPSPSGRPDSADAI